MQILQRDDQVDYRKHLRDHYVEQEKEKDKPFLKLREIKMEKEFD